MTVYSLTYSFPNLEAVCCSMSGSNCWTHQAKVILQKLRKLNWNWNYNLYAGQEATVRMGRGTTDWFQIGKGVRQAVYYHPAYLTSMQSTLWETRGWKKHKLKSRLPGEISITSDMQMTPPLWQKVKRRRSQDGGGVGRGEHFLPHKFIKRAYKRRVNSTKQLLNAGRGHQAPRKAAQLFERR